MPDVTLRPTGASFRAASVGGRNVDTQIAALDPPAGWSPDAGRGVAVALVDTGVTDTPDLHGSRLVRGPDLSGEGDGIDHYGHGTFMAGLIAGDGSASAGASTQHFGVAPGATLVSVKVAGADGSTTVSRIIAGIGWVVSHRDTYGIGVLNLSFGVDAPDALRVQPAVGRGGGGVGVGHHRRGVGRQRRHRSRHVARERPVRRHGRRGRHRGHTLDH